MPILDTSGNITTKQSVRDVQQLVCPLAQQSALQDAYKRYGATNGQEETIKPIYWTFQFNFAEVTSEGNPFGCYRLYARNEVSETYEAIDNGGILVNTCLIVPFGPSNGTNVHVTTSDNLAFFDGNGYIMCKMNISEWTALLRDNLSIITGTTQTTETLHIWLTNFLTPTHYYTNFLIQTDIQFEKAKRIDSNEPAKIVPIVDYGNDVKLHLAFSSANPTFPVKYCLHPGKKLPLLESYLDLENSPPDPNTIATLGTTLIPNEVSITGEQHTIGIDYRTPITGEEAFLDPTLPHLPANRLLLPRK